MISHKQKIILRRYLEGGLAEKERRQFERDLAENGELRACLEEMNEIDRILSEADTSAPRADLLDPIMNAVRQHKDMYAENTESGHNRPAKSAWQKTLNWLFPNPQWNMAWGFIAGMIAGVAVMGLFHLRQPSEVPSGLDVAGTFAARDTKGIVLLPVDLPEIKLSLSANPLPQNYTQLNIEVVSGSSSIIQLLFNTTSFQVWSLRSLESKPGCQIMAGYNYVEIGNQGQNSYVILLKKLTTIEEELTVSIFLDGNLEFNTQVKI